MSEVKVNKISPRTNCGTVQLGDSGDTFTIPAGATITNNGTASGFGATGSASWTTTVKTGDFTAVAGEGYFVDTTSGAISVNLPAGTAGAVVAIKDYANTFSVSNKVTLVQNGSDKIGGSTVNATLDTEGIAVTLVFVDSTKGWLVTDSGLQSEAPTSLFITATGGTITTVCTNFKVHTFTGPGTFCVSCAGNAAGSNEVSYMVVAGGGGGGESVPGYYSAGGGGAGGFREGKSPQDSYTSSPIACTSGSNNGLPVSVQGYSIVVGAGGGGGAGPTGGPGVTGSLSSFSTISSAGGGYGGVAGGPGPSGAAGAAGGSGGGGGAKGPTAIGGAGNTPSVSPSQGFPGGGGSGSPTSPAPGPSGVGGGGGGALGAGTNATPGYVEPGGPGATTNITGSPVVYSIGGASGNQPGGTPTTPANSGTGGQSGGNCSSNGAAGGSGIVVIRYKFQ
jgi:hypothetical protein